MPDIFDKTKLTKMTTNDIKKLIRNEIGAKEKWRAARELTIKHHGHESPLLVNMDKAIKMHEDRASALMDFITPRVQKELNRKKKQQMEKKEAKK